MKVKSFTLKDRQVDYIKRLALEVDEPESRILREIVDRDIKSNER